MSRTDFIKWANEIYDSFQYWPRFFEEMDMEMLSMIYILERDSDFDLKKCLLSGEYLKYGEYDFMDRRDAFLEFPLEFIRNASVLQLRQYILHLFVRRMRELDSDMREFEIETYSMRIEGFEELDSFFKNLIIESISELYDKTDYGLELIDVDIISEYYNDNTYHYTYKLLFCRRDYVYMGQTIFDINDIKYYVNFLEQKDFCSLFFKIFCEYFDESSVLYYDVNESMIEIYFEVKRKDKLEHYEKCNKKSKKYFTKKLCPNCII